MQMFRIFHTVSTVATTGSCVTMRVIIRQRDSFVFWTTWEPVWRSWEGPSPYAEHQRNKKRKKGPGSGNAPAVPYDLLQTVIGLLVGSGLVVGALLRSRIRPVRFQPLRGRFIDQVLECVSEGPQSFRREYPWRLGRVQKTIPRVREGIPVDF